MASHLPPSLKKIFPYVTISNQFIAKQPAVSYYMKLFAIQEGMALAKGDPEAKTSLLSMMGELEKLKSDLKHDPSNSEYITNEVLGQSLVEEAALKLFDAADSRDRNANFNKSLIKTFYTASHLLSCLKQFGELDDEIEKKVKYAKWKAVEIDRCLKAGIQPTPGPPTSVDEEDEFGDTMGGGGGGGGMTMPQPYLGGGGGRGGVADPGPSTSEHYPPPPSNSYHPVPMPRHNIPSSNTSVPPYPQPGGPLGPQTSDSFYPPLNVPPNVPPGPSGGGAYMGTSSAGGGAYMGTSSVGGGSTHTSVPASTVGGGAVKVGPEQVAQAQKYCKYASSALDYDDSEGAIEYLGKALHLLKTGKEL